VIPTMQVDNVEKSTLEIGLNKTCILVV